ncbi:glycoside hydrolase family 65 protein [Cohnella herbarum]|uniref:Glycoside hydrolase family 65 protein n=1 Tax=Cohnella herbarum TaxID=2728023 RepID=A0A7Z2VIQ2_9BACL|nr:glycoside hydrolase family 65 protein [Cohnella herbarum]QJD83822.1 glycoside hydrolase family 65 protein [Cohnella herbarum]
MSWIVEEIGFDPNRITTNGNKFMLGNGAMGYRGTLEEFKKEQLPACTLAGLYDKVGDQWREPINAPNGLFTQLILNGEILSPLTSRYDSHRVALNIRDATYHRDTAFVVGDNRIEVRTRRFLSMEHLDLILMKVEFRCSQDCEITVRTGIDGDVWDINGPHLQEYELSAGDGLIGLSCITQELKKSVSVAEGITLVGAAEEVLIQDSLSMLREIQIKCFAGETYGFTKYVAVGFGDQREQVSKTVQSRVREAMRDRYETLLHRHALHWERKWELSDVEIEGDDDAQFALRYSIYQLHIIAPTESEKVSIPARGLSGQVYKGAVFWDTEMFMLPFFLYSQPKIARNLVMYRVHTLDGARRKAAEYGYRGAYYAWESQDTGDDACTLFNITDVFTNRPMRTYFRDKQVHISADAAYGIWQYYEFTGDDSVLLEGGAEVLLECARFFYSYSYYKEEKNRYEILDVTGPDEYHERVNNNAFTNELVRTTLEIAFKAMAVLESKYPEAYASLMEKLDFSEDLGKLSSMLGQLYTPQPDPATLVIEQFDGYSKLEDVDLRTLKSRIMDKNEYLGGGNGLATTTQILKQADVVLMLHLFKNRFSQEVKKANWEYYEPRTEHGSSLSSCVYALVAADIGNSDWAYPYFMRTATIDLTGDSKQYVGTLYIGGTHPAANGGAWMAAVLGFAGLHLREGKVLFQPSLPEHWQSIAFPIQIRGQQFRVNVTATEVVILSDNRNKLQQTFQVGTEERTIEPGGRSSFPNEGKRRGDGLAG